MTLDELNNISALRDRLGEAMSACQTDQLRYYIEQFYLESESLITALRCPKKVWVVQETYQQDGWSPPPYAYSSFENAKKRALEQICYCPSGVYIGIYEQELDGSISRVWSGKTGSDSLEECVIS